MTLNNRDQQRIKRYLLGQLNDEEQQKVEDRLMTESDFFEEFEVSKDEIIEEYCEGELTAQERDWLEQHFLASPEGKLRRRFALALNRGNPKSPKRVTLFERLRTRIQDFWRSQWAIAAVASAVLVLVVGGIVLRATLGTSQSTSSKFPLTLTNSAAVRAEEAGPTAKVSLLLDVDELVITLVLPESSPSASSYRVEAVGGITTLSIAGSSSNSVSVIIPTAQLRRGQYALRLYAIKADGTEERVSGNYFFTVE
jgi:hypothetical protein